ncbi:MAG: cupin domain-containing protein [Bdellovibrionota bacterium]
MNDQSRNYRSMIEMQPGEKHRNTLIASVNDHCVRMAVTEDTVYGWHHHPNSDELFLVLEGELRIEFENAEPIVLRSGDLYSVPAGRIHRTIAKARTTNFCFESKDAETVFNGAQERT